MLTTLCAGLSIPGAHAGWFNHHGMTCATPDSAHVVHLPAASKREFHGIGSTVGTTSFYLELGDCDPHTAGIDYALLPSYRQARAWARQHSNGGLIPDSRSTARGVVVQVLDAHAQPVAFETPALHPVMEDIPHPKGGKIPFQAQYVQTGTSITPGTLHALMTVVYRYH